MTPQVITPALEGCTSYAYSYRKTRETWTTTEADRQRLEAFEIWIWRRVERISWVGKVSNADALRRVKEDKCMLIQYVQDGRENTMVGTCSTPRGIII